MLDRVDSGCLHCCRHAEPDGEVNGVGDDGCCDDGEGQGDQRGDQLSPEQIETTAVEQSAGVVELVDGQQLPTAQQADSNSSPEPGDEVQTDDVERIVIAQPVL